MRSPVTCREKLPSALTAIAVQAGLAALLVFSLNVARPAVTQKETIITLPRLTPPPPMMIDARGRPPAAAAPSPQSAPETPAPAIVSPAAPSNIPAERPAASGTAQAQGDCTPTNRIGVLAQQRVACPPPGNGKGEPFQPQNRVKNEAYWEAERAASRAPPRVPCVSLTSSTQGQGGFQREDHGVKIDIGCALAALFGGLPSKLPPREDAPPDPRAPPPHVSDEAFRKSLQAVNDRKRAAAAQPGAAP